jgi:ATP-dependent DNA helicase RecQ
LHLSFKDVWLDYFITRQHLVSQLKSGDTLTITGNECTTANGQSILKFSKQFLNIIETQKQKGYHLQHAKVNFIVYWKKEDAEHESKIILPELYFER